MTTVEIERLTTILQRSEVELTGSRSTRDDIVIRRLTNSMKCSSRAKENWQFASSIGIRQSFARSASPLPRSPREHMAFVCTAKRISRPSVWPLYRGRPHVSSARRRSTAARLKSMTRLNYWLTPASQQSPATPRNIDNAEGGKPRKPTSSTGVLDALGHLPLLERAAVFFRDVERLPLDAVAKELGCSTAAVRCYLAQGRIELRRCLDSSCRK